MNIDTKAKDRDLESYIRKFPFLEVGILNSLARTVICGKMSILWRFTCEVQCTLSGFLHIVD